ncbi:10000_t:CDS:2 [Paraglomus brasilianum]|uniref:10000_t:CDS:1 n=1 Tax=Paraglomus brasilianum TaxID=144538 RepID=A0A9N9AKC7_9GLOM|nr:10000_t:CDS:2 [Paraglomus brasilianum]
MSQQPFQTWQSQHQQQHHQQEYVDGSNQSLLYQSQNELQAGQLPLSSFNLSQLPNTDVGGLPTYSISQLTNQQQVDDSNMVVYEQLVTGSIQQQNNTLSARQNLLTHRQQRQQQWLSQYPYSRQREVRTPNEYQLDRQNSVQDMFEVFPTEQSGYVQQVYPPTGNPSMSQSQGNIHQVSQLQNNFSQLGNGFPNQPSQMETDERSLQSQERNLKLTQIKKSRPSTFQVQFLYVNSVILNN